MKKIIPYLIIIVLLFGIYKLISPGESQKEKELREKFSDVTDRLAGRLKDIRTGRGIINELKETKKKQSADILYMLEHPIIKNVTEYKEKEIEKIVHVLVPKTEYIKVYDFLNELKDKFCLYFRTDEAFVWTVDNVLDKFEGALDDTEKKGEIKSDLKVLKYKRKWTVIGAYDTSIKGMYVKIRKYIINSSRLNLFIDGKYMDPFGDSGKFGAEIGFEIKLK